MNHYTGAFRHYADFHGRATRSQFWFYALINTLVLMFLLLVPLWGLLVHEGDHPDVFQYELGGMRLGEESLMMMKGFIFSVIYSLASFIPSLSVQVRRLHDIGKSGWLILLSFIPIIGTIVLFVWYCTDSDSDNHYGPNPKASEMKG